MGILAFRHVACLAKQDARPGAMEEVDDTVLMEEIDEARDDLDRSEIMLSGLDSDEALAMDGRLVSG